MEQAKTGTIGLRLVSHASVLIEALGTQILTDPWFAGKAFNDSWALIAEPARVDLSVVDFLWLSHEHPDHFHIPTLKALPDSFKERVTVLFQESSDHPKMAAALYRLGFNRVILLPHKKWVEVAPGVEVLCFQSRQIDSALAVRSAGEVVLNLNDCEFGPIDLSEIKRVVGTPTVLLNQFSIAGFDGIEADLPAAADRVIDDMVAAHRALGAKVTVPFASFAYFCRDENAFLNRYANAPRRAAERFVAEGLSLQVLAPGQALGEDCDAVAWWDSAIAGVRASPVASRAIGVADIEIAFATRCRTLRRYHGVWRRILKPVVIESPGLGRFELDFARGGMRRSTKTAGAEIAAQPLHHMLEHDFGLQTLGVSGCYRLAARSLNWMLHRVLFAMVNAGIGLSLRQMADPRQIGFLWRRRGDLIRQVVFTLRHHAPAFRMTKPITTASERGAGPVFCNTMRADPASTASVRT